jgi:3',5'-cyclic AMP phosphodiesterase CpdA
MIIGQITDTHVLPEGRKLGNLIDTNAQLEAAVCLLNRLSTPPDAVLVTGDLTDDGECESYAVLRARLAALDSPFYLIPGNHDRRQALVDAFPDHAYLPRTGYLQYAIEDHAVRLIALDTLVEGSEDGALCEERLAWLDAALAAEPDRPALVFMHHPPFESGIWWMDAMGLSALRARERAGCRGAEHGLAGPPGSRARVAAARCAGARRSVPARLERRCVRHPHELPDTRREAARSLRDAGGLAAGPGSVAQAESGTRVGCQWVGSEP